MNTHHTCVFHSSILPPHIECSKFEGEGVTIYAVYWKTQLTCVMQQDGPVTIMDYHLPNNEVVLYDTLAEAMPVLLAKLSRLE